MRFPILNLILISTLAPLCIADDLSEAIDMPDLTTTTGGNGNVSAQTIVTHDGVDAVELSTIANQNTFWFETTIVGPAAISFYYKFEPDRISNWAGFLIDGQQQMRDHFGNLAGTRNSFDWTKYEYEILEEGNHTLRWTVRHGYYVDDDTKAWVDELIVNRAPIIKEQPSPVNADEGESVELSIDVNLPEKVTYQWRQNGTPIDGATSATLNIASAQASTTGVYDVEVSNAYGTTYSTPVDVFVFSQFGEAIEQPDLEWRTSGIGWSPQSTKSHDGVDSLELNSRDTPQDIWFETTINGPFALSYWWKLEKELQQDKIQLEVNGTAVASYNGNGEWAEASYETTHAGPLDVRWTFTPDPSTDKDFNTYGWVDELEIEYIPSIVTPPQDLAVDVGDPIQLEVTAVAETAISYQWYHDGELLAGQTSAQLNIANATVSDAGVFHVVTSTGSRSVESAPATVQVLVGFSDAMELSDTDWTRTVPSWYAQTEVTHDGVDALEASLDNESVEPSFQFEVQGPFELSFWWRQSEESWASSIRFLVDGVVINEKRDESSWTQVTFTGLESKTYTLAWQHKLHHSSSSFANAYLDEFLLSQAPIITTQPESWYFAEGEDANFSVLAVAQSAISYQWRKGRVDLVGENSSTLVLSDVQASDIGDYDVVLTSTEGETVSESFEILDSSPLAEAIEQPHLVWKTNGDVQWLIDSTETDGSESSLKSGDISGDESTWISTMVEGESELTFNWKASTEACCDRLKLYLDGVEIAELRGEQDWALFSYTIPAGLHELKWVYSKDATDDAGQDSVWIDSVQLNPIITDLSPSLSLFEWQDLQLTVSLAGNFDLSYSWIWNGEAIAEEESSSLTILSIQREQAGDYQVLVVSDYGQVLSDPINVQVDDFGAPIDQPNQEWDFSEPTWRIEDDIEGRSAAVADGLGANESRWFEHEILGSATIAFDWYLKSNDGDEMTIYINDVQQTLPTASASWVPVQFEIPESGTHTLRWSYSESSTESGEADYAAVDSIEIDQTPQILSQPHQVVVEKGNKLELTVESEARGSVSYQWYFNDEPITDATTQTYTVSSPTELDSGTYHLSISTKHDTVSSEPISVTVSEPLSVGLDTDGITIESGVPRRWYTDKSFSIDGEDSISVVPLETNETAEFSILHTGPFHLSFEYWIGFDESSETELTVSINNTHQFKFTKQENWKKAELTYPIQGEHEIKISVTHQPEADSTPELWIDSLLLTQLNATETASANWVLESGGLKANYINIGSIQDPDHDGLANLFEYWIQSDPFVFSDLIQNEILLTDGNVIVEVGIEIAEPQLAVFELIVETSTNLDTWQTIETTSSYSEGILRLSVNKEKLTDSHFFRIAARAINP